jgi:hypothetical protein
MLLAAAVGLAVVVLSLGGYFLFSGGSKPEKALHPAPTPVAPMEVPSAPRNPVNNARTVPATPMANPAASQTKRLPNTEAKVPAPVPANPAAAPQLQLPQPQAQPQQASNPVPASAPVEAPAAADTTARRAAALDALGMPGQESEEKRRNALKALTGQ